MATRRLWVRHWQGRITGALIYGLFLTYFSCFFFPRDFTAQNSFLSIDLISFILIFLTLLVRILGKISFTTSPQVSVLLLIFHLIIITICFVFCCNKIITFYFFFEFSLVPIMLIIIGWGYQPERLPATFALLLYTITCSLPLLLWVVWFNQNLGENLFFWQQTLTLGNHFSNFLFWGVRLGFLVKLPVYFVHLWLPQAHVEAPVFASIILAAILLKLGGYGLIRVLTIITSSFSVSLLQMITLIGGALISYVCVRQTDIKILIAYSSVSHIALVARLVLGGRPLALTRALWIMTAHGISSSFIFAAANIIYLKNHTRRLVIAAGFLGWAPLLTLAWFVACLANIAAPPTFNFLAEAWRLRVLLSLSNWRILPILIIIFIAAAYSLVIYAALNQGQLPSTLKTTYSYIPVFYLLILLHIIWTFGLVVLFFYVYFRNFNLNNSFFS